MANISENSLMAACVDLRASENSSTGNATVGSTRCVYSKRFKKIVLAWFGVFALAACGSGKVETEWLEEVQLSSGETIVVKRIAGGSAVRELGGPSAVRHLRMSVMVEKATTATLPPLLDFTYVPVIFDYDMKKKEWFVVATFYTCDVWYDLGRPRLPYLEYHLRGGKWIQVELSEELFGKHANMLVSPNLSGEKSYVSLEYKSRMNKSAGDKYRKILDRWYTAC